MKFDIKVKNPESGFERALAIYLKLTSKWFEWLGWVLILGTLHCVAKQSKSGHLSELMVLTYALLWAYFFALFSSYKFEGVTFFKTRKQKIIFSIIIAIIALVSSAFFCRMVIIVSNQIGEIIKA